jgi:hypothetical protein
MFLLTRRLVLYRLSVFYDDWCTVFNLDCLIARTCVLQMFCLCLMIDAHRVNMVREALKSLKLKTFGANTLWLKASVTLIFCPNNFINHYCIRLALTFMGSY